MRKLLVTLALAASGLAMAMPGSAMLLSFAPSTGTTTVGNNVSVDVVISGLTATNPAEVVAAFDFGVVFDPAVLAATVSSHTNRLGDETLFEAMYLPATVHSWGIELTALSLLPDDPDFINALPGLSGLQSDISNQPLDSFTLATIQFTGATNGASALSFDLSSGYYVVGRGGAPLPVTGSTGCIGVGGPANCTANNVPEPATLALLALGIAGLATSGRRKGG